LDTSKNGLGARKGVQDRGAGGFWSVLGSAGCGGHRHCLPLGGQCRVAGAARIGAPVPAAEAARSADASHIVRGNASRARLRVAIAHVFAARKCRLGLIIRSVGLARAATRLGLANLVTNMTRLAWFETRTAPA
jgi:hypothetical protein